MDKLATVWRLLAEEFKDASAVIGYNVINEPWAGNVFKVGVFFSYDCLLK